MDQEYDVRKLKQYLSCLPESALKTVVPTDDYYQLRAIAKIYNQGVVVGRIEMLEALTKKGA